MIKFIFYGLVIYLIYKLVFDLVVPVSKASVQMKQKLQEMQDQQNRFQQEQAQAKPAPKATQQPSADKDYIEYEEVKP
jgi:type II secretory pathway component PulM